FIPPTDGSFLKQYLLGLFIRWEIASALRPAFLQLAEFLHLFQILENFVRFLLVDPAEGEADVDDDIITDLCLGHVGQAGFLEDAAEIDLAHARQRVIAADAFNFSWNGQTHGLSLYSFRRKAATTCPRAIPPSFGGTRWCQYGRKPSADKRRTARLATATMPSASALWNLAEISPIGILRSTSVRIS